jgi:inorganic pyrophosphatase
MQDEKGPDAKIICVEPHEPRFRDATDIADLQPEILEEIKHFFDMYKMLEPGKHSITGDYEGRDAAWREIHDSAARYAAHRASAEAGTAP